MEFALGKEKMNDQKIEEIKDMRKIKEEMRKMKEKIQENEKENFIGLRISIETLQDRLAWSRLPTESAYLSLCEEITLFLP